MTRTGKSILLLAVSLCVPYGISNALGAPNTSDVCDSESGAAYGLCNAYCEAMDCDSDEPRASIQACDRIFDNYDKVVGGAPPCVDIEVEFEVIKRCPTVAAPGDSVTYVIGYLSTSDTPFGNVLILDELPVGFDFVGYEHEWNSEYIANNGTASSPTVDFDQGRLLLTVGPLNYMEGGTLTVFGFADLSLQPGQELSNDVLGIALSDDQSLSSEDQCNTLIVEAN